MIVRMGGGVERKTNFKEYSIAIPAYLSRQWSLSLSGGGLELTYWITSVCSSSLDTTLAF
jgi:hypothetical protein